MPSILKEKLFRYFFLTCFLVAQVKAIEKAPLALKDPIFKKHFKEGTQVFFHERLKKGIENLKFLKRDLFHSQQISYPLSSPQPVILSFLSRRSGNEIQKWVEQMPLKLLHQKQVRFLNIVFPGGIFFMIPEKRARERILENLNREITSSYSNLSEEDKLIYDSLKIHWLEDRKRQLFQTLHLDSRIPHFFLLSQSGEARAYFNSFSRERLKKFIQILESFPENSPNTHK